MLSVRSGRAVRRDAVVVRRPPVAAPRSVAGVRDVWAAIVFGLVDDLSVEPLVQRLVGERLEEHLGSGAERLRDDEDVTEVLQVVGGGVAFDLSVEERLRPFRGSRPSFVEGVTSAEDRT